MADYSLTIAAIQDHQMFDRSYYLEHNQDVAGHTEIDPLMHYLSHGGWEGRDPHPLFDSSFYLEQNPHVVQQQINPLVHFLTEGARQGLDPHPLFSTSFYLEQGLSMAECSFNPLIHYLESSAQEGFDPHPLFDGAFYLQQLERLEGKAVVCNPLVHYLTVGAQHGLEPGPNFDGNSYYKRYPDVAAAGVNPLLHYVTTGQSEGRLGRRLYSIAAGADSIKSASFQSVLAKLRKATEEPFSHVVISCGLTRGGSVRCACSFAKAIADNVGLKNVLFLVTDEAEMTCSDWLPDGTRIVNLPQLEPSLSEEDRAILFLELLVRGRPVIAMGFNSCTFWTAIDGYVDVCKRELSTRLVGYLGGYEDYVEMNGWGFNDGPINRLVSDIALFVTDNDRLRNIMIDRHRNVPSIEAKVVTCYKSLTDDLLLSLSLQSCFGQDASTAAGDASPNVSTPDCRLHRPGPRPRKILWASRLDRVKQPDILAKIAEQMPDVQFDVYGRSCPHIDLACLRVLPNIALLGEYADFAAIPKDDKAAFLHTSKSDSVPHVLVEAAASGLPVIAPNIGAIGELIDDSTGWLVRRCDDVLEYVKVIRHVLDHPEQARERAGRLQTLVNERHKWAAFSERVNRLDIWDSAGRSF